MVVETILRVVFTCIVAVIVHRILHPERRGLSRDLRSGMRFGERVQGICEEVFAGACPSRWYGLPFVSGRSLIGFRVLL